MNLHPNTFGATPASLYLVSQLNKHDNKKFTRKISKCIISFRTTLDDLITAHDTGNLSIQTLCSMLSMLDGKLNSARETMLYGDADYEDTMLPDELSVNLMVNIITGDIKSAIRRSRKVSHIKKTRCREQSDFKPSKIPVHDTNGIVIGYLSQVFEPVSTKVYDIHDDISAGTLQKKSREKLRRLGKKCELY
jgi:hypothetical protein